MKDFKTILDEAKGFTASIKTDRKQQRVYPDITATEFKELFSEYAKGLLYRKNHDTDFIINDNIKPVLNQLYFWLIGSEKFTGNIMTGILLLGNIGVGKTLLIETFLKVYNSFCDVDKKIHTHDSRQLFYKLAEDGINNYASGCMFVDDIGKEPLEFTSYGFTKQPMVELLNERHRLGRLTFATGNYILDDYANEIYNKTIADRFKEMFNIIVLKGESLRK